MLFAIEIVAAVLALAILVFIILAALQPAHYRLERSAVISAAPAVVFAQVNDLHMWEAWSPWAKLDPTMKTAYTGPSVGEGAAYTWSGNKKVGEGRMTITQSRPVDLVRLKLEFVRPFKDIADTQFDLKPHGDHTHVTWSMSGEKKFMGKAFCMIMSMDKLVGGDFERGLAQLQSVVASQTDA